MNKKINEIRHEYNKGSLSRNDMPKSPFAFFEQWYKHAIDLDVYEPNAMAISTVNNENSPTSRMVLLRGFDENGFVFYTNYNSKKGNNLIQNKKASLLFYWHQLHRQIRIEGNCEKLRSTYLQNIFIQDQKLLKLLVQYHLKVSKLKIDKF